MQVDIITDVFTQSDGIFVYSNTYVRSREVRFVYKYISNYMITRE